MKIPVSLGADDGSGFRRSSALSVLVSPPQPSWCRDVSARCVFCCRFCFDPSVCREASFPSPGFSYAAFPRTTSGLRLYARFGPSICRCFVFLRIRIQLRIGSGARPPIRRHGRRIAVGNRVAFGAEKQMCAIKNRKRSDCFWARAQFDGLLPPNRTLE